MLKFFFENWTMYFPSLQGELLILKRTTEELTAMNLRIIYLGKERDKHYHHESKVGLQGSNSPTQLSGTSLNVSRFQWVSQASASEKLWGRKPKNQGASLRWCAISLHLWGTESTCVHVNWLFWSGLQWEVRLRGFELMPEVLACVGFVWIEFSLLYLLGERHLTFKKSPPLLSVLGCTPQAYTSVVAQLQDQRKSPESVTDQSMV